MLILSKAELVAKNDKRFIRSPKQSFPLPSVIRIANYYRVPYRLIEQSRKNILRRDNFKCQYCGTKSSLLTIDHVIPKSKGGLDTWENLVTACIKCNNKKGNRTPDEANMPLIQKPKRPNHIFFLKQFMGKLDDYWKPFLFID